MFVFDLTMTDHIETTLGESGEKPCDVFVQRGNSEVQCPVCRTQIPLDKASCGERLRNTHDDSRLSGSLVTVRPVANDPSPTEETASNAPSTSELAIIFHLPLPIALKRPPHYPRDGTFHMNFRQSCINLVSYAPAVEVTTTGHDDCEPLLHLTIIPEQESLRSNDDAELVF